MAAIAKDGRASLDPPPPPSSLTDELPSQGSVSEPVARELHTRRAVPAPDEARTVQAPRIEPGAAEDGVVEILVVEGDTETPAHEATVEVSTTAANGQTSIRQERTDEQGRLRMRLQTGDLHLVAWSHRSICTPRQERVEAGEERRIVLRLQAARSFGGVVVDEHGVPIPDAEVRVWTHNQTDLIRTGPDGTFDHPRFPAIGKAQQIHARAEGYGSGVRYLKIEESGRWSSLPALADQPVLRGEEDPWIELVLVPERRLWGRVLDERGRPVAGVNVAAEGFFRVLPAVASRDVASAHTDTEGRFELSGLRSDISHTLTFKAAGYAAQTLPLDADVGTDHDIGGIFMAGQCTLSGVVHDAEGQLVEDVLVRVIPIHQPSAGEAKAAVGVDVPSPLPEGERTIRTDAFGRFELDGLLRGSYHASVERDDGPIAFGRILEADFDRSSAELELHVPASLLVLRGRVLQDGEPLASARVEVRRYGHVAMTTTNHEGFFRVSGLDDRGLYEVSVSPSTGEEGRELAKIRVFAHESPVIRTPGKVQRNLARASGR